MSGWFTKKHVVVKDILCIIDLDIEHEMYSNENRVSKTFWMRKIRTNKKINRKAWVPSFPDFPNDDDFFCNRSQKFTV